MELEVDEEIDLGTLRHGVEAPVVVQVAERAGLVGDMDMVRPSMEAACMDVFATAKNAGWELRTIPCKNLEYGKVVHSDIVSVGFVLIE